MSENLVFDLKGYRLQIDDDVTLKVNSLVMKSGLYRRDLQSVYKQLQQRSANSLTKKKDLRAALKCDESYSDCKSHSFPGISGSIFEILDTTNNGIVDLADVICSLGVLLQGSKSQKLAFLFDICDEDGDKRLTKRQLWKFIRCFLAAILLFCTENSVTDHTNLNRPDILSLEDLKRIGDEVSVHTCGSILYYVNHGGSENPDSTHHNTAVNTVSFEDIAGWYSHTGYATCSWFELLDLNKWLPLSLPARTKYPIIATHHEDDMGSNASSLAATDVSTVPSLSQTSEASASVLYQIQLCDDRYLILTDVDAEYIKSISISTGFFAVDGVLLVRALQYFINDIRNPTVLTSYSTSYNYEDGKVALPFVSYANFVDFIQGILPNADDSTVNAENGKLAATLSYVFSLFEQYINENEVASPTKKAVRPRPSPWDDEDRSELETDEDTDEPQSPYLKACYYPSLACGLSLLCRGSKSAKLSLGFQLFDLDHDGYLSINEFAHYLSSFLTVLLGFSNYAVFNRYFPPKLSPAERKARLLSPGSDDSSEDSIDDGWLNEVTQDLAMFIFTECEEATGGDENSGIVIRNNALYISFETFGAWYNGGGYKHMSWIELVDLCKWVEDLPGLQRASESEDPRALDEALNYVWAKQSQSNHDGSKITLSPKQNSDDYDESYSVRTDDASREGGFEMEHIPGDLDWTGADTSPTAFTLNLYTRRYDCVFPVSELIVRNVCLFTTRLGFSSLAPSTVAAVLLQYVNPTNHLLSKANYNLAVNELLRISKTSLYYGTEMTQRDSSRIFCHGYNVLLDSLYYAYSRNSDLTNVHTEQAELVDQVDVVDIICGLSVLCQGSKSDKLLLAFDMVSSQYKNTLVAASTRGSSTPTLELATTSHKTDEISQGNLVTSSITSLSRYETFRFFRNFLVSLFTLCGCHLQLEDSDSQNTDSISQSTRIIRTQEKLLDNVSMHVVHNLAAYVEQKIASESYRDHHVRICFDDIAEWYSGKKVFNGMDASSFKFGHEVISWLELLDMNKWIKLIS